MTQPKNITVNPPKQGHGASTVGHLLNKTTPHMAEPYDRRRELEFVRNNSYKRQIYIKQKERKENKKKLQENPFKSTSHGDANFATIRQTFGKDDKILPPVDCFS